MKIETVVILPTLQVDPLHAAVTAVSDAQLDQSQWKKAVEVIRISFG